MTEWKQARKKPVVIQYREPEPKQIQIMTGKKGEWTSTREGMLFAVCGEDFIIKGVDGETYPIKKDIFAKTYDLLTDSCSSNDNTSTNHSNTMQTGLT